MNNVIVTTEPRRGIRTNDRAELLDAISTIIPETVTLDDVNFLCIGTDRSTGDALGPLVGNMLVDAGYRNVLGTIDNPVHAENLIDTIANISYEKTIIAIDASLGNIDNVGKITVSPNPIRPGEGIGKYHLPEIGHYTLTGVVNVAGFMEYFVLQATRLSVVMSMSRDIAYGIMQRFPLKEDV